ncbi:HAD family hydrolase [Virgibacillus oceani]|uniref:HAD family hydrolase n=1 Tax=Virgibacillus oceani TaxID=1479511 RepID=UPI00166D27D7|nr:HAD family hydrolase [Virgibacillus oceani]
MKAVIFDFDGLILDTETAWYDSYKEVLNNDHAFDLPLEEFVKCVGSGDESMFRYLRKELGSIFNEDVLKDKANVLHTEKVRTAKARDGVEDYLADAAEAGYKIALATSSSREWVDFHLTNLGLITYFDYLITQDDVEHIKPAPDLFLKAIEVLNIQPSEAIVFEDSLNGLIAAQKANVKTIIIPNPVTESLPFKDYHLKLQSMKEMRLGEIVKSI